MNIVIVNGINVTEKLEKYEELKRDVARYLELQKKFEKMNFGSFVEVREKHEYFYLYEKLSKIGKEE